ncbi:MAG: L-idonate 5-dehydrogenase [Pseudomonadota bacterium]
MRALVAHAARDIRIEDQTARDPGENEVLVRVLRGGICGSDLHYYNHGGFGTVRLREPMVLGHEVAGEVLACGPGVDTVAPGQLVAVSPSRPCGQCVQSRRGLFNHCLNMRFYGSAMPFPHIQGAFRERLVAHTSQLAVADGLSAATASMAEPLAVAIHAANQAGSLVGKRVLITGCGPIGMLCLLVAQAAGAVEVVVTDLADFPLRMARTLGATRAVNVATEDDALDDYTADKGYFDVLFECSGAEQAFAAALPVLQPGGVIVQLGLGGDMTIPMQLLTAKELQLRGSFRFHEEFFVGVQWMRQGRIDVTPLQTHTFALDDAEQAFAQANDRSQAMKVHLDLG